MKKRILTLVLALAMIMATLAGCGGNGGTSGGTGGESSGSGTDGQTSDGNVTISFFDKNSGSNTFDDAVAQEIMKRTGVTVQVENPTGDPLEKLNLMLTGQNYPDIVLMERGNEIVNRYIEAGALLELDELIEEHGPNIKAMYGETLNKIRHTDGKNYYLSNWYGKDTEPVAGVLMRYDYLCEIVGEERANSTEPFTQAEYLDILDQFKTKYPTIDGKESIAVTLDGESTNYEGTLRGMFGMTTYANTDNGLTHWVFDEQYEKMITFMNTLYTEGYLDKEWVVNKKNQWVQKLSAGNVFSSFCSYWDTDSVNASLAQTEGEGAVFYSYKVVGDGVTADETTYTGRSSLGWDAIAITDNCADPVAAIKFIDFLVSEEGQYLMMWGLEGETWNYEDGVHVPTEEIVQMFLEDPDNAKLTTGARKWTWFIKNGPGSDGTVYDIMKYEVSETTAFAFERFGESDYYDTALYEGLEPAGSSPEGLKWQKVKDLYDQTFPKMVDAADEEEAKAILTQLRSDMISAGMDDVAEIITANYQQRVELWGIE